MPTKILLIEDNPDHILLTKRILERADQGYQVDSISEAKEGIRKIIEESYDLILCDCRLPHANALDIIKEIKTKGIDLPFIAITALGSEKIAVELMKEGAYDYIIKDASYEDVLPVVIKKSVERYKDITERRKTEEKLQDAYRELKNTQEQLIQSGKMSAMGQLAAGISHELNQPLTGIKGFAQAALLDLDGNNLLREDLEKIIEQADRMDKIIRNIRFFARKSEFILKDLDINQPIEGALMLLSEQLKVHNIQVDKSLANSLPRIYADPNQLQQVFLNLIANARDAIDSLKRPESGKITIKSLLSEDKKHIEVILEDNGGGISKKDLGHIFDPFFTTKSPDGGMGLGLSIVYRIIENHKGVIEVESEKGKGSKFKIRLPAA